MKAEAGISAAAGLSALLFLTVAAAPANAAEIIVYEDAYYSGASRHYQADVNNLAPEGFNDRISSIRVVSGFWTVCADAYFSGRCESVSGDVSNLASTGLNDRISSIRLEGGGYDDGYGGYDGIVLFADVGFRGREVRIDYDTPNLGEFDFNDRASSLRVLNGTWEVCEDGNYRGRCELVSGDAEYLGGLNDRISSVRLVSRGDDPWDDSWGRSRDERWEHWSEHANFQAEVFEHTDYRGERRHFNSAEPDLKRHGFNDRISSFRLVGRWQVCEHVNFGGECEIFRFDDSNLVPDGWNDRISSMRPIGYWDSARAGLVLFEDSNFRGDRQRIRDEEPDLRSEGFNDVASSLRVREGRWEVCVDSHYRGRCEIVDADEANLGALGLNDRISSARRVGQGGPGYDHGITIFEHTNYAGRSFESSYDVPNLAEHGFNDILSSLRIHEGVWELCEHGNYGGRCWTFDSDSPNVVPLGMNDRISSMRRVGYGGGGHTGHGEGQIRVYEHTNYEGRSRTYSGGVANLGEDGWNDQISSFRIDGPGQWEICDDAYHSGRCQIFSTNEPNLVQLNWNDRISSIRYLP